jgi:hypothetical protein
MAETVNFDQDKAGAPPAGWKSRSDWARVAK